MFGSALYYNNHKVVLLMEERMANTGGPSLPYVGVTHHYITSLLLDAEEKAYQTINVPVVNKISALIYRPIVQLSPRKFRSMETTLQQFRRRTIIS